jgi:hypothetical protein
MGYGVWGIETAHTVSRVPIEFPFITGAGSFPEPPRRNGAPWQSVLPRMSSDDGHKRQDRSTVYRERGARALGSPATTHPAMRITIPGNPQVDAVLFQALEQYESVHRQDR